MQPTPTRGSSPSVAKAGACRWPARLDLLQGVTALALAAFLALHTLFVGTLLFDPDAFTAIVRVTDLTFLFGHPIYAFHVLVASLVAVLLVLHAVPALRKIPKGHRDHRSLRRHLQGMRHFDSTLWYGQVVSGILLFVLASVHLYAMITQPDRIGAEYAVERIVDDRAWLVYVLLTPIAQFHTLTGLYRLALKRGLVRSNDPLRTRTRLRRAMWVVMAACIGLGLATLTKELHAGLARRSATVPAMS